MLLIAITQSVDYLCFAPDSGDRSSSRKVAVWNDLGRKCSDFPDPTDSRWLAARVLDRVGGEPFVIPSLTFRGSG